MRRLVLGFAIVALTFEASKGMADYLVIKVDINRILISGADPKGNPMPNQGFRGGFGMVGFRGGFGQVGFRGGFPNPLGNQGGKGADWIFPGGGFSEDAGKESGGARGTFPTPNPSGFPMPPGGFTGNPGQLPKGPNQVGSFPPGFDPKDFKGFPKDFKGFPKDFNPKDFNPKDFNPKDFKGFPKPPAGDPDADKAEKYQPRWAYAYLELTTKPIVQSNPKTKKPAYIQINHLWGKDCAVPVGYFLYIHEDSRRLKFDKRLQSILVRESKEPKARYVINDAQAMLRLGEWALEHGMMKEFHAVMNELSKLGTKPETVVKALAAYNKVRENLKKVPSTDDASQAGLRADLKSEGYRLAYSPGGHYTVLTNVPSSRQDALRRRMVLMEDAFERFFYWFAFNSTTVPPMPAQRQLAILVADAKEFYAKHAVWGSLPLVGDGFLPRRDNAMVLSAEPLDETLTLLKINNDENCKHLKMGRDELLTGKVWMRQDAKENVKNTIMLQSMILVQKAMEEETERATISHEAVRQLLFSTGLLPRNVAVPEWIQYGLASFFESPPGSFYPGLAIPSWSNLLDFKYFREKKMLGPQATVLQHVITDDFFQRARASTNRAILARSARLADKAKQDEDIARSTAWALVYYLVKTDQLNVLFRYSQELDSLPRDLELTQRVLHRCFTRAFDKSTTLPNLADRWFTEMQEFVLEIPAYERAMLSARLEEAR
jgi:hypothetical protein